MAAAMKTLIILLLMLPLLSIKAQEVGRMAEEKPREVFPLRTWGMDFMFSEGGFGLGTFFRYNLTQTLTAFSDISISGAKDDREMQYIDYFGNSVVLGKKNRIFLVPLVFGLQQRILANSISDNLRPYITAGMGPSMAFTTPYDKEFFSSFSKAQAKYTVGGYFGIGANFGLDKTNLMGISVRYYLMHFFDEGIESLIGRPKKDFGGFYLTLNLGYMY
jgi:hypothetical protein